MAYIVLGILVVCTEVFIWYGQTYRPVPPPEDQLITANRLLATKVMQAEEHCDLETIRNLAQRTIFTTVVQVKNFTSHCKPGALSYTYANEEVKSWTMHPKNGPPVHYKTVFVNYIAQIGSHTFPMHVTTTQVNNQSVAFYAATDPYYQYIKDVNIFAEGSAP